MEDVSKAGKLQGSWWRLALVGFILAGVAETSAWGSTYAVYIPLDSSIYTELETLNGLGYADTYLDEIKPISRVEAARLVLKARGALADSKRPDLLANSLIQTLEAQLPEEIGWLENNAENNQPTMIHPIERLEAEYVYSSGEQREWRTSNLYTPSNANINAQEGTPLLPNNDGLPTGTGSNEIASWSGWAGFGGFLTGYSNIAIAGPFTHSLEDKSRVQPLGNAVVASLGNVAISFGTEEMRWGTGYFNNLAIGNNASPFPAVRIQNIHPTLLPWIFRYLGQFRHQHFFGQLDSDRYYAHPWFAGQIYSFRPLPTFEFGFTHLIELGGVHNDDYGFAGFLGRATGFDTGNPNGANTHSRGGIYLKFYFPSLRNLEVYQEIVGNDNLDYEIPQVGRFLPFLAVSYQGGFYLPRLTADGLTDLRFEYAILEPNDQIHDDSLYWTYEGQLMGDSLGPNASEVDLQLGRWVDLHNKLSADLFYSNQAPTFGNHTPFPAQFYPYPLGKEQSGGIALELLHLPRPLQALGEGLVDLHVRAAMEYAQDLNYQSNTSSMRFLLQISGAFTPAWKSWAWN